MTPEQLEQINATIKETIKIVVNGKIDLLQANQKSMDIKLETYIKEDNEWKLRANPILEMGGNLRGFGKVTAYLLAIVAAFYGIFKIK